MDSVTPSRANVPIPEAQVYVKRTGRYTDRILKSKKTRLEPESQTLVKVKTDLAGFIIIEPLPNLYDKNNFLTVTGVYQTKSEK